MLPSPRTHPSLNVHRLGFAEAREVTGLRGTLSVLGGSMPYLPRNAPGADGLPSSLLSPRYSEAVCRACGVDPRRWSARREMEQVSVAYFRPFPVYLVSLSAGARQYAVLCPRWTWLVCRLLYPIGGALHADIAHLDTVPEPGGWVSEVSARRRLAVPLARMSVAQRDALAEAAELSGYEAALAILHSLAP